MPSKFVWLLVTAVASASCRAAPPEEEGQGVAPQPAPTEDPLAKEKAMTPNERTKALQAACFSSGVCDEDTLDRLTRAAESKGEAEALARFATANREQAIRRAEALAVQASGIVDAAAIARARPGHPGLNPECMARFQRTGLEISRLEAAAEQLALTIEGVSELRFGLPLLRNCVSCADDTARYCKEVTTALAEAHAGLARESAALAAHRPPGG